MHSGIRQIFFYYFLFRMPVFSKGWLKKDLAHFMKFIFRILGSKYSIW